MNNFFKNRIALSFITLAIFGIIFYAGYSLGIKNDARLTEATSLINQEKGKPEKIDFSTYWKVWNVIQEQYVPTRKAQASTTVTDQEKVWGSIEGLAHSLGDPYTVFFPPEQASFFESEIAGNFQGVGMEVGVKDKVLTVVAPLKGTPAEKAGIKSGDKILKIGDAVTNDMSVDQAVKLIRGPKGTEVKVTIFRDGVAEPFEVKIVRDVIDIPTIDTEVKKGTPIAGGGSSTPAGGLQDNGVFVIRLYSFSANSANLFREALREFILSGSKKLIIDLRGNPGGYLEAAVDIASWFLPAGNVVVSEEYAKHEQGDIYRSKGYGHNLFDSSYKTVILVDGGSASASEILAGALSEYNVATLIGAKTFGKGSVQQLIKVTPDTAFKVTIARWLTPKGHSISEEGLKPDIDVKVTAEDLAKRKDAQMERAVKFLTEGK